MMEHNITAAVGARPRRKRVGRGESSGHGKTSTRGNKGCQSRAGGGVRPLSEGGQLPIFRRIPKRGFSNFEFAIRPETVNVGELERLFNAGDTVSAQTLREKHLIRCAESRVKVLGDGALTKKLTVEAHFFSAKAKATIEQAGGTVKVIEIPDPAAKWKAKRNVKKRERQAAKGKAPKAAPKADAPS